MQYIADVVSHGIGYHSGVFDFAIPATRLKIKFQSVRCMHCTSHDLVDEDLRPTRKAATHGLGRRRVDEQPVHPLGRQRNTRILAENDSLPLLWRVADCAGGQPGTVVPASTRWYSLVLLVSTRHSRTRLQTECTSATH